MSDVRKSANGLAPTVKLLIDGKFVESTTKEWLDDVNPATQAILGRVPMATADEVNAAVASATRLILERSIADAQS